MAKVNQRDLDWDVVDRGEVGWRRKQLGEAAEGDALGCSLYELPPGTRSWPYHYHAANEEALFVLEGAGSLRHHGEMVGLEAGDYVAFPADERGAHRVINDTDDPLRYLMVSTMVAPDVTVYPDSEKIGALAASARSAAIRERVSQAPAPQA
jgi:uncharacterized cupin superfamily protein